ncbi:MAG: hypothetical protein R2736_10460 [Solirubrobacterales bacterium]
MRELTYTQPQIWILIGLAVIAVLLVTAWAAIARSSRREAPFDQVKKVGYGIRTWWLIGFGTLLTTGVVMSFFFLPYSGARSPHGTPQDVAIKGGQFYWTMSPNTVHAGRVKIALTSADVNHGLGIYGPRGEMIGSVQAMPGYTNRLDIQLDEPGEYLLSCLEFCGIGHHKMHAVLKVTPGQAG